VHEQRPRDIRLQVVDRESQRRHRHASAQSVTVAELQARSTPIEQDRPAADVPVRTTIDLSGRVARASAVPGLVNGFRASTSSVGALARFPAARPATSAVEHRVTEPPRVGEQPDEAASSNPLAKTIMVMLAAMLACGVAAAIGAFNTVNTQRFSPSTPVLRPAVMAGPVVMRPDLLDEQLTSGTGGQTDASVQDAVVRPDQPALAERQRAERVVIAFYHALPLRPDRAFEMLGPSMQGEGKRAFESAWENAKDVEPTILGTGPGGEVLVSVSISRWDTSALLTVVQSISVSDGPQPLIVWGELLSAHRG
jgi:hypothetical protein